MDTQSRPPPSRFEAFTALRKHVRSCSCTCIISVLHTVFSTSILRFGSEWFMNWLHNMFPTAAALIRSWAHTTCSSRVESSNRLRYSTCIGPRRAAPHGSRRVAVQPAASCPPPILQSRERAHEEIRLCGTVMAVSRTSWPRSSLISSLWSGKRRSVSPSTSCATDEKSSRRYSAKVRSRLRSHLEH